MNTASTNSRNPYIDADGIPRLKNSVVALVDILGFKEMTSSLKSFDDRQQMLQNLHKALQKARDMIEETEPVNPDLSIGDKAYSAVRAFTDNIVIGYPIHDDGESQLCYAFNELSYYQMMLTMEGFFVRGSISIGDLYMDDFAVFGNGLIDAYKSEAELARDPRIILAHSAREAVDLHINYYSNRASAPQNQYLLKDTDGQYFINYLDTVVPADGVFFKKELKTHKDKTEERLTQHKSQPTIWSKYLWTANYHNYFCDQKSFSDSSLKIDMSHLRLAPATLIACE